MNLSQKDYIDDKYTPTSVMRAVTYVVLGEELLGKRGTHAHSALDRGGAEVGLSHLSSGRSLVQISFHCDTNNTTRQCETKGAGKGTSDTLTANLLFVKNL